MSSSTSSKDQCTPNDEASADPPHCHTPPQLPHGLATKDCQTLPVEPIRLCNGSVAKMSGRLDAFFEFVRRGLIEPLGRLGGLLVAALRSLTTGVRRFRWRAV